MYQYTRNPIRRNSHERSRGRRQPVRWHGPRFVQGRRSRRITTVWILRLRRLSGQVQP